MLGPCLVPVGPPKSLHMTIVDPCLTQQPILNAFFYIRTDQRGEEADVCWWTLTEDSTHFPPRTQNMDCLRQARATGWQFKALGPWMRSKKTPNRVLLINPELSHLM